MKYVTIIYHLFLAQREVKMARIILGTYDPEIERELKEMAAEEYEECTAAEELSRALEEDFKRMYPLGTTDPDAYHSDSPDEDEYIRLAYWEEQELVECERELMFLDQSGY